MAIFNRLPKWPQIAAVYSVIVLIVYGWTIIWSFWKLPSWLYFLSVDKILMVYVYSMATNLLESLLVLLLLLGLSLVLPRKWFSEVFVTRSVIITLVILGYAAYLLTQFQSREDYPEGLIRLIPVAALAGWVLAFGAGKMKPLVSVIDTFAQQATIFLYFTIPISLISLLVILVRGIF